MLAKNRSPPRRQISKPGKVIASGWRRDVAIGLHRRAAGRAPRPADGWSDRSASAATARRRGTMPCRTPKVSSAGDDDRGEGELPPAADEQIAQIAGLREMQHRRNDDGGERRVRHASEQRGQQNQGEEAKDRGHQIRKLGAGARRHGHGSLGQAADDEEAAEEAAQDIGGPVGDQLLVRIDGRRRPASPRPLPRRAPRHSRPARWRARRGRARCSMAGSRLGRAR